MAIVQTNEFRTGMVVIFNNDLYTISDFQHVKPGKGQAFTRTKLKNVRDGRVIDNTFRSGDKMESIRLEEKKFQYLYDDGENYHFMNLETYDQIMVSPAVVGAAKNYLVEEMEITLQMHEGEVLGLILPNFVEMEITYCEPGERGNTAQAATKPATLSTGAVVNVPLFVNQNEWIRVDTRTNEYIERVKR